FANLRQPPASRKRACFSPPPSKGFSRWAAFHLGRSYPSQRLTPDAENGYGGNRSARRGGWTGILRRGKGEVNRCGSMWAPSFDSGSAQPHRSKTRRGKRK